MSFDKLIKDTLDNVVKGDLNGDELTKLESYIKENGWPGSYPKISTIKAIELLISEKLPYNAESSLIDLLIGVEVAPIKLNKTRKALLKKVSKLIEKAKDAKCDHVNLGIAAFMHGGGFTMPTHTAELICKDCGLNITLCPGIPTKTYKDDFGIIITPATLKKLDKWAESIDRTKVRSSSDILKDPVKIYNESIQWDKAIPLKIVDIKKLNSKTGL